jgi:hypothetical protein
MKWYKLSQSKVRQYRFDNQDNIYYKILEKEKPFQEDDVIKVYHAFRSPDDAFMTDMYGLSGQEQVGRTYSYESNNNPYGLFVTTDLDTAKEFTIHGYIMEFDVKYSELESPVWPKGGYTVQGEMSEYWDWDKLNEQREEGRLSQRERAIKSEFPAVRDSSRPELAESLMNPSEYQALFVGHLSPDEIKAFWIPVVQDDGMRRITDKWERLSPEEFRARFENDIKKMVDTKDSGHRIHDLSGRIFTPDQEFDPEYFIGKVVEHTGSENAIDIISNSKESLRKHFKSQWVWPKQYAGLDAWIDSLPEPNQTKSQGKVLVDSRKKNTPYGDDKFCKFLDEAHLVVESWPEWKQNALRQAMSGTA